VLHRSVTAMPVPPSGGAAWQAALSREIEDASRIGAGVDAFGVGSRSEGPAMNMSESLPGSRQAKILRNWRLEVFQAWDSDGRPCFLWHE